MSASRRVLTSYDNSTFDKRERSPSPKRASNSSAKTMDSPPPKDAQDDELTAEEMLKRFPPPPKRFCPVNQKPVLKNGQLIPREDALLMEMVMADKATLQAQLDITKKAIVGLEYVTEYIDPDGISPRVYNCTLCSTFRTVGTIMEHICGYNHRVNYIKEQFPNEVKQYMLPDGRRKNRNSGLMMIASKRCQELELVYGRGDYVAKTEKVKIPEGALDAPETDGAQEENRSTESLLPRLLKDAGKVKLENQDDVQMAKQIISILTDAICEHKYAQNSKK